MTCADKVDLPTIASFWFGSDLSWLEVLCIRSFVDRGHQFRLYVAEDIKSIPSEVDVRPASEILWPPSFEIADNDRHRVAVFSDIFRLFLIRQTDCIWVDLDAYCVRPFAFSSPHVFAPTKSGDLVNGVLGLPSESPALSAMIEFVTSQNPTQPWRGRSLHRQNARRIAQGEAWGIQDLIWGCSGPKALHHFLMETGEAHYAMPAETFYPLSPTELRALHDKHVEIEAIERPDVYSVHIYGHQKKNLARHFNGLPADESYLAQLCERHQVDPKKAPIPLLDWMLDGT